MTLNEKLAAAYGVPAISNVWNQSKGYADLVELQYDLARLDELCIEHDIGVRTIKTSDVNYYEDNNYVVCISPRGIYFNGEYIKDHPTKQAAVCRARVLALLKLRGITE